MLVLVTTIVVLVSLGLNPALIAIILGIDRILDMCRTTLNVTGDLVAAQVISAGEPRDDIETEAKPQAA